MNNLDVIDLTYPESLEDWIKLIESVETISGFKVLCGLSNIEELQPIAAELMINGLDNGVVKASEIYLIKIATKCVEDESIGKRLYLYFLSGIKEYNLPTINGDGILDKISLKELNSVYKTDFDSYMKNSQNGLENALDANENASEKIKKLLVFANLANSGIIAKMGLDEELANILFESLMNPEEEFEECEAEYDEDDIEDNLEDDTDIR